MYWISGYMNGGSDLIPDSSGTEISTIRRAMACLRLVFRRQDTEPGYLAKKDLIERQVRF